MELKEDVRVTGLRSLLGRADFLAASLAGVLGLAAVYYGLLSRVSDFGRLADSMSTEPAYLAAVLTLMPLSFGLFGLNFGVLLTLRRAKLRSRAQAGNAVGAATGAFAAGCPLCGAYLLTLLGVSSGLAALPFGGLELWVAAAGVMAFTLSRSLAALRACSGSQDVGACATAAPSKRRDVVGLTVAAVLIASVLAWMVLVNEPAFR
ncbi:MAG: hypothetical protein KY393_01280 [Actinobacteria bacterium]|nr:hypothetical protein [Actinomycetota bacterium]